MIREVYLAGAIGCYHKENNIEKATCWRNRAKEYFENHSLTFECIDPMDYYRYDSNYHTSDNEVMRFYFRKIEESRAVLVNLLDLYRSTGTSDEIIYAWMNNIPVIAFLEDESLINTVHEWKFCQIDRIEVGEDAQDRAMEYIKNYYG